MDKKEIVQFLERLELFSLLDQKEVMVIADYVRIKHYNAGQYLFKVFEKREELIMICKGKLELLRIAQLEGEQRLTIFGENDFLGEGALMDDSPQSTSARVLQDAVVLLLSRKDLDLLSKTKPALVGKILIKVARIISRRMRHESSRGSAIAIQYQSGKTRVEHDLLGEREVPFDFYYGIQTMRAMENFSVSGIALNFSPVIVESLAMVKMAAARANLDMSLLSENIGHAIIQTCQEIINGKLHSQFVVDMIQGGAGTSTNMNANEVIANRALEILGYSRGEYGFCHPNNHVNLSQSTNDVYPTAVKISLIYSNKKLIDVLSLLISSFRNKGNEFSGILKMGRTQLQDAVPMTMGQAFEAYAVTLEEEIDRLNQNASLFLEVNMGATAIGTGINAATGYSDRCVHHLQEITGLDIRLAKNLIEATQDTGAFVMYSSAVKRLAIKLSKISNDLRLMSSGPRAGLNEINLPAMQPGSSIMPGKVNPVIPEVVNQIAFKVIGNDLTVTMGAESGQLELNVMEPVMIHSIFESIKMLKNGMLTLKHKCIDGITANEEECRKMVYNSIGLITALNPLLGYEISSALAKEALDRNCGIYELVLEKRLLSKEQLDMILSPEKMTGR